MTDYVIKKGDTLSKIALVTGVPVQILASANNIKNPNKIREGNTLTIPDVSKVPPAYVAAAVQHIQDQQSEPPAAPAPEKPHDVGYPVMTESEYKAAKAAGKVPDRVVLTPDPPPPPQRESATPSSSSQDDQSLPEPSTLDRLSSVFQWAHDNIAPDKVLGLGNVLALALGPELSPEVADAIPALAQAPARTPRPIAGAARDAAEEASPYGGNSIRPTEKMIQKLERAKAENPGIDPLFWTGGSNEAPIDIPPIGDLTNLSDFGKPEPPMGNIAPEEYQGPSLF